MPNPLFLECEVYGMYLESFLHSLEMLRKPELVDNSAYPNLSPDQIIYYGYEPVAAERKEAQGSCRLYYCTREAPLSTQWIDVSVQYGYLQALRNERIDLCNAISNENAAVVMKEALWLFDALTCSNYHYLDLQESSGLFTLRAICGNNEVEEGESVLWLFGNNVLARDISLAQAQYFVKRYIKASPYYLEEMERQDTGSAFEEAFQSEVLAYYKLCPPFLQSEYVTGKRNLELEDFVQALDAEISGKIRNICTKL